MAQSGHEIRNKIYFAQCSICVVNIFCSLWHIWVAKNELKRKIKIGKIKYNSTQNLFILSVKFLFFFGTFGP